MIYGLSQEHFMEINLKAASWGEIEVDKMPLFGGEAKAPSRHGNNVILDIIKI